MASLSPRGRAEFDLNHLDDVLSHPWATFDQLIRAADYPLKKDALDATYLFLSSIFHQLKQDDSNTETQLHQAFFLAQRIKKIENSSENKIKKLCGQILSLHKERASDHAFDLNRLPSLIKNKWTTAEELIHHIPHPIEGLNHHLALTLTLKALYQELKKQTELPLALVQNLSTFIQRIQQFEECSITYTQEEISTLCDQILWFEDPQWKALETAANDPLKSPRRSTGISSSPNKKCLSAILSTNPKPYACILDHDVKIACTNGTHQMSGFDLYALGTLSPLIGSMIQENFLKKRAHIKSLSLTEYGISVEMLSHFVDFLFLKQPFGIPREAPDSTQSTTIDYFKVAKSLEIHSVSEPISQWFADTFYVYDYNEVDFKKVLEIYEQAKSDTSPVLLALCHEYFRKYFEHLCTAEKPEKMTQVWNEAMPVFQQVIRELHLIFPSSKTLSFVQTMRFIKNLSIESGTISDKDLKQLQISCHEPLSHLTLKNCPELTPDCGNILAQFHLESLDISFNPWVNNALLTHIANIVTLEKLDLSGANALTSGFLKALQGRLLSHLKLNNLSCIEQQDITDLSQQTTLQTLDLSNCMQETALDLTPLKELQLLITLNLAETPRLNNLNFVNAMPNLEQLNLADCDLATGFMHTIKTSSIADLDITGNHPSDQDLQDILKMRNLTILSVSVKKGQLVHLKNLRVKELRLTLSDVTDAELDVLTTMPDLRKLVIENCGKLTAACLGTLQKLNPESLALIRLPWVDDQQLANWPKMPFLTTLELMGPTFSNMRLWRAHIQNQKIKKVILPMLLFSKSPSAIQAHTHTIRNWHISSTQCVIIPQKEEEKRQPPPEIDEEPLPKLESDGEFSSEESEALSSEESEEIEPLALDRNEIVDHLLSLAGNVPDFIDSTEEQRRNALTSVMEQMDIDNVDQGETLLTSITLKFKDREIAFSRFWLCALELDQSTVCFTQITSPSFPEQYEFEEVDSLAFKALAKVFLQGEMLPDNDKDVETRTFYEALTRHLEMRKSQSNEFQQDVYVAFFRAAMALKSTTAIELLEKIFISTVENATDPLEVRKFYILAKRYHKPNIEQPCKKFFLDRIGKIPKDDLEKLLNLCKKQDLINNIEALFALRTLDFSSSNISNKALTLLVNFPNLRSLNLSFCNSLSRDCGKTLATLHLEELVLNGSEWVGLWMISSLNKIQPLKKLGLSFCSKMKDDALPLLSIRLKHLDLSHNPQLKIDFGGGMSDNVREHLETLDVSYCNSIQVASLEALSQLPRLQHINLSDNDQLSRREETFKTLAKLQSSLTITLSWTKTAAEYCVKYLKEVTHLKIVMLCHARHMQDASDSIAELTHMIALKESR